MIDKSMFFDRFCQQGKKTDILVTAPSGRTREKLAAVSRRIILYGSASRGENDADSDLDLFVEARDKIEAEDVVRRSGRGKKIQAVIWTSAELADRQDTEKVFINEVERGIVLWEDKT